MILFILGSYDPGYSHLRDTMSSLGAAVSPVSDAISLWWISMGVFLIIFGIGLQKAFSEKGSYARIASLLIILYAIGEGIGSGVFKANRTADGPTTSAMIHDILGGIGVTAILIFPMIMQKVISKREMPFFHRMSWIVFICGIVLTFLFLLRYLPDKNNFFLIYKGLWQRLFMLNTYTYLITLSILMLNRQKINIHHHTKPGP